MVKKYGELYLNARKALRPSQGDNASVYARELLSLASGKSVAALLADRELYASEEIEEKLNGFLARILAGEPLAYILGEWSFYGLPFLVTPDVSIVLTTSQTQIVKRRLLPFIGSNHIPKVT